MWIFPRLAEFWRLGLPLLFISYVPSSPEIKQTLNQLKLQFPTEMPKRPPPPVSIVVARFIVLNFFLLIILPHEPIACTHTHKGSLIIVCWCDLQSSTLETECALPHYCWSEDCGKLGRKISCILIVPFTPVTLLCWIIRRTELNQRTGQLRSGRPPFWNLMQCPPQSQSRRTALAVRRLGKSPSLPRAWSVCKARKVNARTWRSKFRRSRGKQSFISSRGRVLWACSLSVPLGWLKVPLEAGVFIHFAAIFFSVTCSDREQQQAFAATPVSSNHRATNLLWNYLAESAREEPTW